jgi:hypothetical protein
MLDLIDTTDQMVNSQDKLSESQDKWVKRRKDNIDVLKKQNKALANDDTQTAKEQIKANNLRIEAEKKFLKATL